MKTLNIGILAHVDAGKTSLTERLLHAVGVIDDLGSVDDGTTRTDSMVLERQRGITIRSAVASFVVDGVTVNLIDTPGHPDFIAEVERVLDLLDGVVLVVSAVEGVQAQTRVLMRTLQRLRLPTLIFINKIDRAGADPDRVLRDLAARLTPAVVATGAVHGAGTPAARCVPHPDTDPGFTRRLLDLLTAHDDALLTEYVEDERRLTGRRLRRVLAAQTRQAPVHPVFAGSAITGAGVAPLIAGLTELLPMAEDGADGPPSGTVFKVQRSPSGERIAYVRLFGGTVRVRDRLPVGAGRLATVTGIEVFDRGSTVRDDAVGAGRIALLRGLGDVRIGDPVGAARRTVDVTSTGGGTVATCGAKGSSGSSEASRRTQRDIVAAGLAETLNACGADVRPGLVLAGRGEAGTHPGVARSARSAEGIPAIHGGGGGQWARQSHSHGTFDKSMSSTAGDFRNLTPLVLVETLRRAGTRVEEPMHRFRLEIPGDALSAVLPVLARLDAVPHATLARGSSYVVEGDVPARRVHAVQQRLPTLTRGEGIFESTFDHHRPVHGEPPTRPRSDHDPTDRKEYLLAVARRVTARRGER
ncbi:GTP-binding protein [Micromonospora sp. U56]|uniref:GTP-binding protein n=1 Tax=Micromonospora sp. U56 TaxID=2824900 RepID=UPI0027DBC8C8|nr:GTP-binding protein [Micromonospora sp. U56]